MFFVYFRPFHITIKNKEREDVVLGDRTQDGRRRRVHWAMAAAK